jgi:hypothetical protein
MKQKKIMKLLKGFGTQRNKTNIYKRLRALKTD